MPEEPIENPYRPSFEGPLFNTESQMAMMPEGGLNGEGFGIVRKFIGPAQRWRAQELADGSYRILHTSSGKVLDVAGASMRSGAHLP